MMDIAAFGLPGMIGLSMAATLAYFVGRWTAGPASTDARMRGDRARPAEELEAIAHDVRCQLATHHAALLHFRKRLHELRSQKNDSAWDVLSEEAEQVLDPTARLAAGIAKAYDRLRQHSTQLSTFREVNIDPLTGLKNRAALEKTLTALIDLQDRFGTSFTLVLAAVEQSAEIDDYANPAMMAKVGRQLRFVARSTDLAARFAPDEFALVLPQTPVDAAAEISQALADSLEGELPARLAFGITHSQPGDTLASIISRADAALYIARHQSKSAVYQHAQGGIRPCLAAPEEAPSRRREELVMA